MAKDLTGVPTGRLYRAGSLANLGAGLARDVAGTAARVVAGSPRGDAARRLHARAAERVATSFGRLKGLPMKFGQILSHAEALVPPDHRDAWRQQLAQLRVLSQPVRWRDMDRVLREELGDAPEAFFTELDRRPIAAASIGQVYRARTRDDADVAVKIQYPDIERAVHDDLRNLEWLRAALSLLLPKVEVDQSIADIAARMKEECDYAHELRHQAEFARLWAGDGQVVIPAPVPELSRRRVLVSEFIDAPGLDAYLDRAPLSDRVECGNAIYRFVFESLYGHGMINADSHAGNFLFPGGGRVAFIDFGCVQRFGDDGIAALSAAGRAAMSGVRGDALWQLLREAYALPDDFDAAERSATERFALSCFEPVLEDRAFRFDAEYSARLADAFLEINALLARKALFRGIREGGREGLIFLNRTYFGLCSVLTALGAEDNFHRTMLAIYERARARRATTS